MIKKKTKNLTDRAARSVSDPSPTRHTKNTKDTNETASISHPIEAARSQGFQQTPPQAETAFSEAILATESRERKSSSR